MAMDEGYGDTPPDLAGLAAVMRGPKPQRDAFLAGHVRRVAETMIVAVADRPRPPDGPSLPDAVDPVGRTIVEETEAACAAAGLDDVQCETLMAMSRRGIEAFAE